MPTRLIPAYQTFHTSNGVSPLNGGKINFFVSESVSTPKDTFSDDTLLIANTNPLILDSAGRVQVDVWGDGEFKMEVTDSADVVIDTFDPITGGAGVTRLLNIAALSAILKSSLTNGDEFDISGFTTQGDGGQGRYFFNSSSTATADGEQIVITDEGGTGRWIRYNPIYFTTLQIGTGIKGNPQTNVGVQIQRDIDASNSPGTSSHGFDDGTFFFDNGFAYNSIGIDLQIGDGTGTSEVIAHVHSVQNTVKMDLGAATLTTYQGYVEQSVTLSGTFGSYLGANIVDPQGVRTTPGLTIPGYEDNGTVTVNNLTGVAIATHHGTNVKSLHVVGIFTDGGASTNSGGGQVDLQAPVVIRQATASTTKGTGALVVTDGGGGFDTAIFVGDEVSIVGDTPLIRFRNASNVSQATIQQTGADDLVLMNAANGDMRFGVNNVLRMELLPDRFRPTVTGSIFLGDASFEINTMFAQTATVVSSDIYLKDKISYENDVLLDAWGTIRQAWYKLKSAIAKKGSDKARVHAGYIAQDIEKALGEDAFKFGLIGKDEIFVKENKTRPAKRPRTKIEYDKEDYFEPDQNGDMIHKTRDVPREEIQYKKKIAKNPDGTDYKELKRVYKTEMVERERLVKNNKGVLILKKVKNLEQVPYNEMCSVEVKDPIMDDWDEPYEEEVSTGRFQLSLRYTECFAVEGAWARREMARMQERIEALEK